MGIRFGVPQKFCDDHGNAPHLELRAGPHLFRCLGLKPEQYEEDTGSYVVKTSLMADVMYETGHSAFVGRMSVNDGPRYAQAAWDILTILVYLHQMAGEEEMFAG